MNVNKIIWLEHNKKSILCFIIALLLSSRILDFGIPEYVYYGTIVFAFIGYYWKFFDFFVLDKLQLFFIIILFLSIVFNDVPLFFRAYPRYFSFLLIIFLFSAIFYSASLNAFRERFFYMMLSLFSLYVLISFVGLLIGIFPLIGRGGFQGIINHSMMMSPVAAISCLYFMYCFFSNKKNIIYLPLIAISIIVTLIGGSRAALLSLSVSSIFFLYKINLFTVKSTPKLVFILFALGVLAYNLPEEYFSKISQKFEYAESQGSMLASRGSLWDARLAEFESSPIYGIGFSSVDIRLTTEFGDGFNLKTGNIEPGSSWGAILSMSGLLGFFTFTAMCLFRIRVLYISSRTTSNALIGAMFVFFLIHMIFEGYIFASGSILMLLFWLTYFMTYRLDKI